MADINLSGLNIDQLTELVGKAQSEVGLPRGEAAQGPPERGRAAGSTRQATGYKLGDIFAELASGTATGSQRQKRPAKYRNPQNPEETWAGIGGHRSGCRRY